MNNSEPMFSVIMPVYNHQDYVVQAVQSVRDQTFDDWELLIVDDGSTDRSGQIVDEHAAADNRIRVIHQANTGQARARNNAITQARGRWVCYLDSDDAYLPDALKHYADYIASHPDAQFVYGYRHGLDSDGTITEIPAPIYQQRITGVKDLFEKTFLSQLCVCYRVELLDKAGGFDMNLFCADDYDLNLRIGMLTPFEPIGHPTGLRRRHDTNMSVQTGRSRMLEAGVLKRWIEKRGGDTLIDPEVVTERLRKLYYSAGRQYFRKRCYRQAIFAFKCAHRYGKTPNSRSLMTLSYLLLPIGTDDGHEIPLVD